MNQERINAMMEQIEKEDGNVIFLEDVHKESIAPIQLPTPDFFSLIKLIFGSNK